MKRIALLAIPVMAWMTVMSCQSTHTCESHKGNVNDVEVETSYIRNDGKLTLLSTEGQLFVIDNVQEPIQKGSKIKLSEPCWFGKFWTLNK